MDIRQRLGTIRVRLVIGFLAAFLGMAVFGVLSYSYFVRMEHKLFFLSQADGMLNAVLEVRRYEKNYLLYQHEKDFTQALGYLDQFESFLGEGQNHLTGSLGATRLAAMRQAAVDYRRYFTRVHGLILAGFAAPPNLVVTDAVGNLRLAGKALIENSEELARLERSDIRNLLVEYRPLLVGFLLALTLIGGLVAYFLVTRLVRPLQTVEEATRVVAQGQFQTIPWHDRDDEIGHLVGGFNRMVVHLRKNNEQMVQTEKLTALGTLTSGVAHELNNPLNNISTSCQILQEELAGRIDEYHNELLSAVDQQVDKAKDIVASLLEFARQREFRLRTENLKTVVDEAVKLVKGEIPPEIELRVRVSPGLNVELDKAHMVQALLNLIMNAIQAMPNGGVLTVRGGSDAQVERAIIEVEDTGVGILPEVLPRIFDPFFTTKDVGRGTGLGLSITYGIIERHRGRVEVTSAVAEGSMFRLSLPLRAERS